MIYWNVGLLPFIFAYGGILLFIYYGYTHKNEIYESIFNQ